MAHTHHHHGHHHPAAPAHLGRAFALGAGLNVLYVVAEVAAGWHYNSMALLADAGHNLGDVASLLLSGLAFWLAKLRPTQRFTYGYRKSTVLASLVNAVLLLLAVGGILWESIGRLRHPEPVAGNVVAWVAAGGILINAASAALFYCNRHHDLNLRGAFLHLLTDALVSAGVVVSGLLIRWTGWYWLDAVTGLAVAAIILGSTWRLLTDSVRLSLDGVPENVALPDVTAAIRAVPGVRDIYHVHIWAMSTTENALTAHLVLDPAVDITALKHEIRHELLHQNVQHVTLEVETGPDDCTEPDC